MDGHVVPRRVPNDADQIDRLARSLWARVQPAVGGRRDSRREATTATIWSSSRRRFSPARDLASRTSKRRKGWSLRVIGVESQRRKQDAGCAGVRRQVRRDLPFESVAVRDGAARSRRSRISRRGANVRADAAPLWLRTRHSGERTSDRAWLRASRAVRTPIFLPDIALHTGKSTSAASSWAIDVLGGRPSWLTIRTDAWRRCRRSLPQGLLPRSSW